MTKLKIINNYGISPNELLNNKKISLKAKGLFGYLQCKPDNWEFSVAGINAQNKDGKDSIASAVAELEKFGYLKRVEKREKGKFKYEWHLTDKPFLFSSTVAGFPSRLNRDGLSVTDNPQQVIKNSNKEKVIKKEDILAKKTKKFIEKLKKEMKGISLSRSQVNELKRFVDYWTEPNRSKTKLRWELQPTWDMRRRVGTWMRNNKNWEINKKGGVLEV